MYSGKLHFYFRLTITFFFSFLSIKVLGVEFSYDYKSEIGPSRWPIYYPECGGHRQSPIALSAHLCQHHSKNNPQIVVRSIHEVPKTVTIFNNGHTVQYSFTWPNDEPPFIDGIMRSRYIFSSFHFHFGKVNWEGSEHTIDSKRFSMEMHLIFYNQIYQNFTNAMSSPNGLVVIGLMFAVSKLGSHNDLLHPLLYMKRPETQITFPYNSQKQIIDFSELLRYDFYNYQGSLTIPPCHETVNWYIETRVRKISKSKMTLFRKLHGNDGLISGNFRPLQSLNGRSCFYYY